MQNGHGRAAVQTMQIPVDFDLTLSDDKQVVVATARCGPLAQQQAIPIANLDAYIAALVKLRDEARSAIVLAPPGLVVPRA